MSEVSILSAQFRALSKTVDQINHAVIILKAQMVNNEKGDESKAILELDEGELEHAGDYMKDFIELLLLLEHPNDYNEELLPNAAVAQLKATVIADTSDFFDQLYTIGLTIEKQQILTPAQLDLLDQIVEALDQERSELFKKLRAARG